MPGLTEITCHSDPVWVTNPPYRTGRRPENMSEDLPLPEEPRTARKRLRASLRRISSTCPSRPKKRWHSSVEYGRNPGNGLPDEGSISVITSGADLPGSPDAMGWFIILEGNVRL